MIITMIMMSVNMKQVQLSNKELIKFIKVLGTYKVKILWCESKIALTNDQLEYLIKWDDNSEQINIENAKRSEREINSIKEKSITYR